MSVIRRLTAQRCTRCGGSGWLFRYANVQGGICFRCGGTGEDPELPHVVVEREVEEGPEITGLYRVCGLRPGAEAIVIAWVSKQQAWGAVKRLKADAAVSTIMVDRGNGPYAERVWNWVR